MKLDNLFKRNNMILLWSLITVACGAVSGFFGDAMMPVAAALLAYVTLIDSSPKKAVSILTATVTAVASVILFYLLNGFWSPVGIEIVAVAVVLWYTYSRNISKAGSAAISTAVIAIFAVLSLALLAMGLEKEYSIAAVSRFYTELYSAMREYFVTQIDTFLESYMSANNGTPSLAINAEELFDAMASVMISVFIITAFFLAGFTYKIFGLITLRFAEDKEKSLKWRFVTPSLYAYFYIVLIILQLLVGASDDVLAIAVINLYNVFMFVYAYVGFNCAHAMLLTRRSSGFAWLILILATVTFSSLAIQILSMLGVIFTLQYNKTHVTPQGFDTENGDGL